MTRFDKEARVADNETTAKALREVFISPNEMDRNMEPANVVDGLFAIARALHDVASAIREGRQPGEANNP